MNCTDGTEVGVRDLASELTKEGMMGNGEGEDDVITTLDIRKRGDVDTRIRKDFVDLHNTLW